MRGHRTINRTTATCVLRACCSEHSGTVRNARKYAVFICNALQRDPALQRSPQLGGGIRTKVDGAYIRNRLEVYL